jgi:hypothetical protein
MVLALSTKFALPILPDRRSATVAARYAAVPTRGFASAVTTGAAYGATYVAAYGARALISTGMCGITFAPGVSAAKSGVFLTIENERIFLIRENIILTL